MLKARNDSKRRRKGEAYIDTCISLLFLLTVLAMGLYIMALAVTRTTADSICSNLLEIATTTGEFGDDFYSADTYYKNNYFDYTLTVASDEYYGGSSTKVQLGHTMQVTISFKAYLVGWAGGQFPITITVTKQGLSQNYWK